MHRLAILMSVTTLAVGAAACDEDDEPITPPTLSVTASPTSFAPGGETTLSITVTDFNLVDPATHGHDGHGHDHGAADLKLTPRPD